MVALRAMGAGRLLMALFLVLSADALRSELPEILEKVKKFFAKGERRYAVMNVTAFYNRDEQPNEQAHDACGMRVICYRVHERRDAELGGELSFGSFADSSDGDGSHNLAPTDKSGADLLEGSYHKILDTQTQELVEKGIFKIDVRNVSIPFRDHTEAQKKADKNLKLGDEYVIVCELRALLSCSKRKPDEIISKGAKFGIRMRDLRDATRANTQGKWIPLCNDLGNPLRDTMGGFTLQLEFVSKDGSSASEAPPSEESGEEDEDDSSLEDDEDSHIWGSTDHYKLRGDDLEDYD